MEIAERRALGANESSAEGVFFVTSNSNDAVAFDLYRNPTSRLT